MIKYSIDEKLFKEMDENLANAYDECVQYVLQEILTSDVSEHNEEEYPYGDYDNNLGKSNAKAYNDDDGYHRIDNLSDTFVHEVCLQIVERLSTLELRLFNAYKMTDDEAKRTKMLEWSREELIGFLVLTVERDVKQYLDSNISIDGPLFDFSTTKTESIGADEDEPEEDEDELDRQADLIMSELKKSIKNYVRNSTDHKYDDYLRNFIRNADGYACKSYAFSLVSHLDKNNFSEIHFTLNNSEFIIFKGGYTHNECGGDSYTEWTWCAPLSTYMDPDVVEDRLSVINQYFSDPDIELVIDN